MSADTAFAPIYFDANATTPLAAGVLECMLPFLRERFGNASSRHEYGRQARAALDRARQQVAAAVGAHPTEVIFTSGGSEANNLFIKGAAANLRPATVAVGAGEHPCVREPARQLQKAGWQLLSLPLASTGELDLPQAQALLAQHKPVLVSQMLANNETGAVSDVAALAQAARQYGAWVHCDAVQALGKLPLAWRDLCVHALSLSSHKVGGPLGAGALIIDKRLDLQALIAGGGHERGLRSGTENVAAIVGFGAACEALQHGLSARVAAMRAARETLERGLAALGATCFAVGAARLPNTSYFAFDAIDGETLVAKLDRAGFAVASGAACSSANPEPSRTLLAMGVAPELARGAVRVSFLPTVQLAEVEQFLDVLRETLAALRGLTAMAG